MIKVMKARKSGFTLVELLIVIMIIAILAGMLLLATGSATDSAEATKIINDLRNLKGAAMMFYLDNNGWPTEDLITADRTALENSLDFYLDRPFFGSGKFALLIEEGVQVDLPDGTGKAPGNRTLIGFTMTDAPQAGVTEKLAQNRENSGIYTTAGALYSTGGVIAMIMR